jgi:hypothetical protein
MSTVKVDIKTSQTIEYWQTVEMDELEYNALRKLNGDDVSERQNPTEYNILEKYIDPRDVLDSGREYFQVEVNKIK